MQWFQQFPEFLPNPFYISGESYAGIFVPTLASQIAEGITYLFSYLFYFNTSFFTHELPRVFGTLYHKLTCTFAKLHPQTTHFYHINAHIVYFF